jgi:hypothetical protein
MALGRLIIEIYKYSSDGDMIPKFEFIPCVLERCLKRNGTTKLEEVIRKGFSDLPRKAQNDEKLKEIMRKLQDAGFGRINVLYNEPVEGADASVELTNITPVSLANADARLKQKEENSIILKGRYSFSDSSTSTKLLDAHRLTIICSNDQSDEYYLGMGNSADTDDDSEICLNITYLEN